MTIKEYIESLKALPHKNPKTGKTIAETMIETVHIWDNEVCRGYCIVALKNAGFDDAQIATVSRALNRAFDDMTVEEAEAVAVEWYG